MNVICFHNPDEENSYLSNWFYVDFVVDRIKFNSGEQYMMYSKAKLFGDMTTAAKILATADFKTIKQLGRKVKPFDNQIWIANREPIMYRGLLAKFEQNPEIKQQLLDTGDCLLAECAQLDKVWGIGLRMTSPNRFYPEKWKGLNLLGKTLMAVRATLADTK